MILNNLTNGSFWGMSSDSPSVSVLTNFIIIYPLYIPFIPEPIYRAMYLTIIASSPGVDEPVFMGAQTMNIIIVSVTQPDINIGVKYGS